MTNTTRLVWVDAAKGISILLVVLMYSTFSVGEDTGETSVLHWAVGFTMPFRMPEFFLISGLFLSQVIGRSWGRYLDRRALHYFYFYVLWMIIHIVVKVAIFAGSPMEAVGQIGFGIVQPYGVLWFIYLLAVFGITTKIVHELRVPTWLVLVVAFLLQAGDIHVASYVVTQFAEYYVYFFIGFVAAPLVLQAMAWVSKNKQIAVIGLAFWAATNFFVIYFPSYTVLPDGFKMGYAQLPGLHFIFAVLGSLAICTTAVILSALRPMKWLVWVGQHSLAIYVAFALPMSIARVLALKTGLIADANLLSLTVFVAALSGSLLLHWFVQATGIGRFLFERPSWIRLRSSNMSPNQDPA